MFDEANAKDVFIGSGSYAVKHYKVNIAITDSRIPMPEGVGNLSDAYTNIGNKIQYNRK